MKVVYQRYFLAEILKESMIAPIDLVSVIQQVGIQPRWTEIALPSGARFLSFRHHDPCTMRN